MKNITLFILLGLMTAVSSCTIEDQVDPNGPSITSVTNDATTGELDLLVYGAESRLRNNRDSYITSTGTIARELYLFDADPRNTEDLLGKDGAQLDNNTFYLTASYGNAFIVVRNCELLLQGVANTTAVTTAQRNGYEGFAKTIKALMLMNELMRLNDNGIRVDVADPDNLGPFVSKEAAFDAIFGMLDEAYTQLQSAEFTFQLSSGFAGYDDPAGFARFNRAVAARAAIWSERYGQAQGYLDNSFYDLNGDLQEGPEMIFSTASGDILNPVFRPLNQSGDQIIVHNFIINNLRAGDTRISKFNERPNPTSQDGLNGTHESAVYPSATAPISIIRNEELILIAAEANMQTGKLDDAVTALNVIRNAYGLGDYTGAVTEEALTEELLYHRAYSLFAEGHRMFDLRRYGLLNADYLPIDRPGDQVFTQFPIPLNENQ